ncbi:hypothetical protein B11Cv2_008810 [Bartonella sp. 1-1C]|nr:hypothetical protein B11Cv2_008810 [Bartonella sp. 1-1C]
MPNTLVINTGFIISSPMRVNLFYESYKFLV